MGIDGTVFFGMLVGFVQNRFILPEEETLKFDLNKLNVVEGFKSKFLSFDPVMEMVKGVLRTTFIGIFGIFGILRSY